MFGPNKLAKEINSRAVKANPINGCAPLINANDVKGNIAVVMRGTCEFTVKVRHTQQAGALATIVIDNENKHNQLFVSISMSGEGDDIFIPSLFISNHEGNQLMKAIEKDINMIVHLSHGDGNDIQTASIDMELLLANGVENIEETLREMFGDLLQRDQIEKIKKVILEAAGVDNTGPVVGKEVLCVDGDCN